MTGEDRPLDLAKLDARVKKAQEAARARDPEAQPGRMGNSFGLGMGMRVGTEMAAALAVGGGIGWFLDRWLGTEPILLLVMLLFGLAAGVKGAYSAAKLMAAKGEDGSQGPV